MKFIVDTSKYNPPVKKGHIAVEEHIGKRTKITGIGIEGVIIFVSEPIEWIDHTTDEVVIEQGYVIAGDNSKTYIEHPDNLLYIDCK